MRASRRAFGARVAWGCRCARRVGLLWAHLVRLLVRASLLLLLRASVLLFLRASVLLVGAAVGARIGCSCWYALRFCCKAGQPTTRCASLSPPVFVCNAFGAAVGAAVGARAGAAAGARVGWVCCWARQVGLLVRASVLLFVRASDMPA